MNEVSTMPSAAPSKAADPTLDARLRAAEGLHEVVTGGLEHLRANQPAAASGDIEGVHQIRVAVRRLRSALVLFEPHLEPHGAARFEDELRRVGRVFGGARDWDVFCSETLLHADSEAHHELDALHGAAKARREAAHQGLRAELASPAFARLGEGLTEWVGQARADPAGFGDGKLRRRLGRVAPDLLDRLARKVDRRGRHLRARSTGQLHALRKSLKKLRYGADFLNGLYGHKSVRSFRHGCKDLQEVLGRINDATVAGRLAAMLDAADRPDLAPAVSALLQWSDRRCASGRDSLPDAWAAFRDAPRFWR